MTDSSGHTASSAEKSASAGHTASSAEKSASAGHTASSAEKSASAGHTASSAVTMYTTSWCGYCVRLKKQMEREDIAFSEVNIEEDESAAERVMAANSGNQTVPTLLFPDGSTLTNPSIVEVKAKLAS